MKNLFINSLNAVRNTANMVPNDLVQINNATSIINKVAKLLVVFGSIFFLVIGYTTNLEAGAWPGLGTSDSPWEISSKAQLDSLADTVANNLYNWSSDKYFKLGDTFDNSATPFTRIIGNIAKTFKGNFDGNGKTIYVNISSTEDTVGLFAKLREATVKNLTVYGSVISNTYVGWACIFGSSVNSTLTNCSDKCAKE